MLTTDDFPNEPIPPSVHGLNVTGRFGIVPQRLTQLADADCQRRVAHDGLRPDMLKEVFFADPTAFRSKGPARLTSKEYTRNFIETRDYGRADSTLRSPAQTDVARFWAENTYVQWSRNLRTLVINEDLSVRETARLLAMAFTASADSLIGCFEAKYFYLWWRPVHAIPRADADSASD